MTYRVLIIDDEAPARDIIKAYLSGFPELAIAGEFEDGFTGLKAIQEMKPDLVFLDVQMPKLTGFELLELLDQPPVIIFSTAYDQYAIRAFELSATDYLLKPYTAERFGLAVRKALDKLGSGADRNQSVQSLVQSSEENPELLQRIAVKVRHNVHVIAVQDILYIEADGDYVSIITPGGKYLKEKTMKYFESHLDPARFVRIHRSFIVNVEQIGRVELYDKEQYAVKLKNGTTLKASSSGYKTLKDLLKL
jgi:two-component system, LytTR family, response regulator